MNEKRASIRVPVDFPVSIDLTNEKTGATARNISKDGMFLTTSKPFAPGTNVILHFSLPGTARSFSLQAKVIWGMSTGSQIIPGFYGMGVHLENVSGTDSEFISNFIQQLLA